MKLEIEVSDEVIEQIKALLKEKDADGDLTVEDFCSAAPAAVMELHKKEMDAYYARQAIRAARAPSPRRRRRKSIGTSIADAIWP